VKKGVSRHVLMISDELWENIRVRAIREHKTIAEWCEGAISRQIPKMLIDIKKGKKIE
jgi:hypothetical protein